ncbi:radical SAM protein, partial [Chloroflexota bacterium]
KDITLEQVEEAVNLTREVGLQTIGYFMIGSPGETPETISRTIGFAKRLKLDFAQFAVAVPFPGTKLYELYLKNGGENVPWENFVYEGTGNRVTPLFETSALSRTDLRLWASMAYKEFYLRPSYLWQQIRRISSPGDLRVSLQGLSLLIKNIRPAKKDRE